MPGVETGKDFHPLSFTLFIANVVVKTVLFISFLK